MSSAGQQRFSRAGRRACRTALLILIAALCVATAPISPAAAAKLTLSNGRGSSLHAGELVVPISKTQILDLDQPFTELVVGDPHVADVLALTNRSLYVVGRAIGSTNLTIYGANRRLLAVVDLVVSFDVEGLKAKLYETMPDEPIEVRSINGGLLLSGKVSSAARLAEALAVAEAFAPKAVTSALSVKGSQQVMLQVRFAEVDRNAERALGVDFTKLTADIGSFTLSMISGSVLASAFATGAISGSAGPVDITAAIQALEKKGVIRVLAEPNLLALSGDTASFLAGGEFPIPIAEQNGSISVSFKSFGVSLAFTPTVIGEDQINLVVAPEVSQIDTTLSVRITPGSDPVPGLTTRRAKTTIELRDGQSFAIAGLLQSTYQNALSQIPWLGDVPVLGTLFRSANFQRNETELVILVTVHLVAPAESPALLAAPTDKFVPPTDVDEFLLGKTDRTPATGPLPEQAAPDGGGLGGTYGHIIK
jgi:pilus assembly protein CpaC